LSADSRFGGEHSEPVPLFIDPQLYVFKGPEMLRYSLYFNLRIHHPIQATSKRATNLIHTIKPSTTSPHI